MTRYLNLALLIIAVMTSSTTTQAFAPSALHNMHNTHAVATTTRLSSSMYFVDENDTSSSVVLQQQQQQQTSPKAPKPAAKKAAPKQQHHKDGLFSPMVRAAKNVLGEEELNRIRGNAIALHSDVIKKFVGTAETTEFGHRVLRALYQMADRNGNGQIELDELEQALRKLGFQKFLGDKQIKGIFSRAGGEEKGFITLEEWIKEAPKTLKTNLVKLAKTNGGDLGFLV